MKNISENFKKNINESVLNIVRCWKISFKDGDILGFSTSDEFFVYNNIKYNSISSKDFNNLKNNTEISEDVVEISNFIVSDLIKSSDILSGKYDDAEVEIFLLNRQDLNSGKIILLNGNISGIEFKDNVFTARIKGLKSKLNKEIGDIYSPVCRCIFCDKKCSLNKDNFTFNGEVKNVFNKKQFSTSSINILNKDKSYFVEGIIEFNNGENINQKTEIKEINGEIITLATEMPHKINIGDTFKIRAGCDKYFTTCTSKFNNAINFRGEPHLPGINTLLKFL